jgi:hypothetical protein
VPGQPAVNRTVLATPLPPPVPAQDPNVRNGGGVPDLYDPDNVRTFTFNWSDKPDMPPPMTPGERACYITGALSCLCALIGMAVAPAFFGLVGLILSIVAAGLPGRQFLALVGLVASGLVFFTSPAVMPHPVYIYRP